VRSLLTTALLLLVAPSGGAPLKADLILTNGIVWTGEKAVQALAVRGDRILAVGTTGEIQHLAEKHTEVWDLKGRLVVPGFIDAHLHLMEGALFARQLDLSDAATPQALEKAIGTYVAAHPREPWLVGRGWSYGSFPSGLPDKALLDRAAPDRAVYLVSYDGHTAWCNTVALLAAQIDRTTKDPPRGALVRTPQGEPTGILEEEAMDLVARLVPPLPEEDRYRALLAAFDGAAAQGLTSAQDANFDLHDLPLLERALRGGAFKLRLRAALPMERDPGPELLSRYAQLRDSHRGPFLHFGGVKGYVDGVVESKTAAMLAPYTGGGLGQLRWTAEDLDRTVARYDKEGYQVLLHAIGDRAIRMALDAFEGAARANGPVVPPRRHRVEHVEVPDPAEVPRFHALGVIASTQAFFANPDSDTLGVYSTNLGPERAQRAMPFKSLDDAQAVQAFGSDWPVETLSVLKGLYAAVARKTAEGTPAGGWHPEQRLAVQAALRHYGRDAAYASFDENTKGSLLPGFLADFVVLSDNILEGPPETLLKARVLATVMGGQETYRAKDYR
jgi:predicted amidohydrolase YtcJ